METNIYVISSVWDREGSTIIGASVDRAGAERIGDRHGPDDGAWAPWVERVDPDQGSCTWERVALLGDGTVHPSLYQEIVCVPLAVTIDLADLPIGRSTIVPVTASPGLLTDAMAAVARFRELHGWEPDRMRVGSGPAWTYWTKIVDSLPPSGRVAAPTSGEISSILGIPVVLDSEIPPDEIRLGETVWVVGTAGTHIPEGTMVRIDQGVLHPVLGDPVTIQPDPDRPPS